MQAASLLALAAGFIALVASLVFGIRGIYSLVSRRCSLLGNKATGRQARIAGLVLACQFVSGFVVYAVLYESLDWGSSASSYGELVTRGIAQAAVFCVSILAGYLIALSIAKQRDESTVGSREEEEPGS